MSFLEALRSNDGRASVLTGGGQKIQLKGTAWIANFPVRNRVITVLKGKDYLGQDIDIGFRIAKFSHPHTLCISMDLAHLLTINNDAYKLTGTIVGWEHLKGVWGSTPYPIIWATPRNYNKQNAERDFPLWETENNNLLSKFIAKIDHDPAQNTLEKLLPKLESFRSAYGSRLGLTEPYIYNGSLESIPEEHKRVYELLQELKASAQTTGAEPPVEAGEAEQANIPPHLAG